MADTYGTTHYHIHKLGRRGTTICLGDFDDRTNAQSHCELYAKDRGDPDRFIEALDYCIDVCREREYEELRRDANERSAPTAEGPEHRG